MQEIELGEITVDVVLKDIKNVHLSVYPPTGRVRISAPDRMEMETIRVYALSKLAWIKKQQSKFRNQERETPREFLNRESHYFFGKRFLLRIEEKEEKPCVSTNHKKLILQVRPGSDLIKKREVLNNWYRERLREKASEMIPEWEKFMEVKVNEFGIKKMRTKWGTCNIDDKRIWLNLELAKKPVECLEYIIVHEMVHFFERNHTERFVELMNHFMPNWRVNRDELNKLPISHIDWSY